MLKIKLFFYKLFNWEYWPFYIVYLPVFFQYLYYVAKTKSFFYFTTVNPTMKNGGFFMNSKKEIYDLIPNHYIPKTLLFKSNSNIKFIIDEITKNKIGFPLIVKPDIGLRGTAVKKVNAIIELEDYLKKSNFDIIIQELINYSNEIGLFYVKLPNSEGKITGIVSKEFMTIKGDGKNSIKELILQNNRFALQLNTLEKEYGKNFLSNILTKNKTINLVPYGNHCRGTKFLDESYKITNLLTNTFNKINSQIKGYYFGRMDIMFNNIDELETGKNFKIIEINGAISEPTHIYDPKHNIFFAWKEVTKHFYYMYKISVSNSKNLKIKPISFNQGFTELKNHFKHYHNIKK